MTAEIAIMNKTAIAMAADSAVTADVGKGQKIFNSANKIFSLSKYHPVGVMVYGNAHFMEVPWETVIKIYREELGKKRFNTLGEYAKDFIAFLDNERQLSSKSEQEKYFKSSIDHYFLFIKKKIEEEVSKIISEKEKVTEEQVSEITSGVIKEHHKMWVEARLLPLVTKEYIKELKCKYKNIIGESKKKVFEKLPINEALLGQLTEIAINLFVKISPKNITHSGISGVVIAGFGDKDIFPSLQSFLIEGVVNNRLKYRKYRNAEITFKNIATIIPFAQHEMVTTFMEGVEPNYEIVIEKTFISLLNQYPGIIVDDIEKLNATQKRKLKKISKELFIQYKKKLQEYRRHAYVGPILKVTAMLSKDELAAMAESLVSLTSFRRKVSLETETVAGPIDVAVISKGDGFIWIKRKHYFEPELNPHFFANYYKEIENEEKKETKSIPLDY